LPNDLTMRAPLKRWLTWVSWTTLLTATTAALLIWRERLDKAHVSLVLLLVVLLGAAAGGRALGIWLAATSFLAFNWYFLRPYGTFAIDDPLDWLVLAVFLLTGVIAAQLLARAQEEARIARARADEVDRLAMLGAETLNAGRAEEALAAIATMIRDSTGATSCNLLAPTASGEFVVLGSAGATSTAEPRSEGSESLVAWVSGTGTAALQRGDGTTHRFDAASPDATTLHELEIGVVRSLLLALHVRGRTVGVLRLIANAGLNLDPKSWRFIDAISYYAALGVERVRLSAEAERAAALREADRMKDALLASVSHDLRTPLTTIRALAQRLAAHGEEEAITIVEETDRLNRMVADLLDLSRLGAGELTLRIELNALDDLLGAVLQRVEPALGERRIIVRLPPDEPLLVGRFDLAQTVRILVNLLENAHKYAPRETEIEIAAARRGGLIEIGVADRGPGIPDSQVERIFEPFYRTPGAAPAPRGAGQGLSIARGLASAEGGSVTYRRREGGGSIFTLTLPAAEIDVPETTAARSS
jgi:two-component system sensor histidine kinase KdpD